MKGICSERTCTGVPSGRFAWSLGIRLIRVETQATAHLYKLNEKLVTVSGDFSKRGAGTISRSLFYKKDIKRDVVEDNLTDPTRFLSLVVSLHNHVKVGELPRDRPVHLQRILERRRRSKPFHFFLCVEKWCRERFGQHR